MIILFICLLSIFCVKFKYGSDFFEQRAQDYITLLKENPPPMDDIYLMESGDWQKAFTQSQIMDMFSIFKSFDSFIYSEEIVSPVPNVRVVETGTAWDNRINQYDFKFNIIFTTIFDEQTQQIIGFRFDYNWTCPSYANPSLFYELPFVVGPQYLPGVLTVPYDMYRGLVVLISGSGSEDADASNFGQKIFKDLAWGLSSNDIIVLRFPKRSYYHDLLPNATYEEEYMIDTESAANSLYEQYNKPVSFIAHGMAGKITPLLCERLGKKCAGFMNLASPTEHLVAALSREYSFLFGLKNTTITKDQQNMINQLDAVEGMLEAHDLPIDYPLPPPLGGRFYPEYLISLYELDPVQTASSIDKPMYFVNGDRDYQSTLDDLNGWRKVTSSSTEFKVYTGLNHYFTYGVGDIDPDEILTPQNMFEDTVSDAVDFIQKLYD